AGLDERYRIAQQAGIGLEDFVDDGERFAEICVAGYADRDRQLTTLAEVVQDFTRDLAVGDHDQRQVRVTQRGTEERDHFDATLLTGNGDVLPDAKWLGEDDREARRYVAEHALHAEGQ